MARAPRVVSRTLIGLLGLSQVLGQVSIFILIDSYVRRPLPNWNPTVAAGTFAVGIGLLISFWIVPSWRRQMAALRERGRALPVRSAPVLFVALMAICAFVGPELIWDFVPYGIDSVTPEYFLAVAVWVGATVALFLASLESTLRA